MFVSFDNSYYTLKTGIPIEEGDSILKLLRRVSRPEIQLGVGIHSELDAIYFSSQEQIALLFLTLNFLERTSKENIAG